MRVGEIKQNLCSDFTLYHQIQSKPREPIQPKRNTSIEERKHHVSYNYRAPVQVTHRKTMLCGCGLDTRNENGNEKEREKQHQLKLKPINMKSNAADIHLANQMH